MAGKLVGIGIGPGDPELITLKALNALQRASVLAYPAPDQGDSLARRIVDPHLDGHHEEIIIRMPMTSARFPAQEVYDWAAKELRVRIDAGHEVVVLCEGDPFFYGSFMYLFARMANEVEVEVIPGVSSLMACASCLGAPLAARNDVLAVLPATLDESALRTHLSHCDAAAIIKVGRHFEKVRAVLAALNLTTHSKYIEHATMASQRVCALSEVNTTQVPYFSMVLVHTRGDAWQV